MRVDLPGRAFGYRRVAKLDDSGEPVRGLLEIDAAPADLVRRIFRDAAAGHSAIQIATALNREGVPGPRGGQWNRSTIQGDPTKAAGIFHNLLYRGKLVWGRREWRKNPDSDKRERRYRLRDEEEWIRVDVPDLRIVDEDLWTAVHKQIDRSRRAVLGANAGRANRRRHLLSGSIHRDLCGARYVISGKDYYRCAGHKERETCGNTVLVRKAALETLALSTLQQGLLIDEHLRLYAGEFRRQLGCLERERTQDEATTATRGTIRRLHRHLARVFGQAT